MRNIQRFPGCFKKDFDILPALFCQFRNGTGSGIFLTNKISNLLNMPKKKNIICFGAKSR